MAPLAERSGYHLVPTPRSHASGCRYAGQKATATFRTPQQRRASHPQIVRQTMTASVMNQTRPATATCAHCKRTFKVGPIWPGADVLQTELQGLGLQERHDKGSPEDQPSRKAFYMNWKTLKGVPKNYNAAQPNILAVTTLVYALRPEIPPSGNWCGREVPRFDNIRVRGLSIPFSLARGRKPGQNPKTSVG